jgi:hypothetical protein
MTIFCDDTAGRKVPNIFKKMFLKVGNFPTILFIFSEKLGTCYLKFFEKKEMHFKTRTGHLFIE